MAAYTRPLYHGPQPRRLAYHNTKFKAYNDSNMSLSSASTHTIHPEDHYTTMDPPQQPTRESFNLDEMLQWENPNAALFPSSDLSGFISPDN